MHVSIDEHRSKLLFFPIIKTAGRVPGWRIFVRTKQHIPPSEVAVIVAMIVMLMVNAMHLRPLKHVPNPPRRSDIRVIKEFAERRARSVHRAAFQRKTEARVDNDAPEYRVENHLARMLVERRDHLDALRTVMDLMKQTPKKRNLVPPAMPPIKHKRRDKVCDRATENMIEGAKMEQRPRRKPFLPGDAR